MQFPKENGNVFSPSRPYKELASGKCFRPDKGVPHTPAILRTPPSPQAGRESRGVPPGKQGEMPRLREGVSPLRAGEVRG